MMDSLLNANGNREVATGFQKGKSGQPNSNPYEMDINGKEKEDLTWLIK